ncbi:MAG: acyltransferase family protein [Acidimicrobiia bacterium]|nr:acyltransferase family protein [Acidimicrobiia bacterium]
MERDRFIDSLRAIAVVAVVLGHWSATSVVWETGRIAGESALSTVSELHYVTWLLQVMPLLFFVGGFSNARSLRLHKGDYLSYLRTRLTRLLQPTVAFIVIWLLLGLAGQLLPLPQPNLLERGADIAALPFWFVGVYVVVVALAPAMYRLHERWRWRVPAALAVGAVLVDVAVHGFGVEAVGFANYAFVWLIPHQFGFFYADGSLDPIRPGVLAGAAGAGLAGLVVLAGWAGYPVSLIMVPGEDRWNSDPPSLPLVAVAVWLVSLALLARPAFQRLWKEGGWLQRINRVPLSMYLWHISVLPVAVGFLYPLGFPRDPVGSVGWWLWRPVWLASLSASLTLVLLVVRRFEVHPPPRPMPIESAARRIGPASFGVVLVAVALLGFGVTGFNGITADYGEGLLGFTLNPLFNTVHLVLGLTVLAGVYRSGRLTSVVLISALILGLIGLMGRETGIEVLATNGATATLDLVLGGLGALAAALATRSPVAMTRNST